MSTCTKDKQKTEEPEKESTPKDEKPMPPKKGDGSLVLRWLILWLGGALLFLGVISMTIEMHSPLNTPFVCTILPIVVALRLMLNQARSPEIGGVVALYPEIWGAAVAWVSTLLLAHSTIPLCETLGMCLFSPLPGYAITEPDYCNEHYTSLVCLTISHFLLTYCAALVGPLCMLSWANRCRSHYKLEAEKKKE